jgi:hypothetical protein
MIAQCFLHIGTLKTGTTSIQNFLAINRQRLLSQGILYPSPPQNSEHIALAPYGMEGDKTGDLVKVRRLGVKEDINNYRANLIKTLKAELAVSRSSRLLLSDENLSLRVTSRTEIGRIKALCDQFSHTTKVIVYLRNQADFLASSYGTLIKSGSTANLSDHIKIQLPKMDYFRLISRWGEIFGRDNMIVRRFEIEDFPNGDLLADFASLIPFDPEGFDRLPPRNQSLSAQALAFLIEFNRSVPAVSDGKINPLRAGIIRMLQKTTNGERLTIPPEVAVAIEKRFEDSNRKVSSEYFSGRYDPLFSQVKRLNEARKDAPLNISTEQAIEIAAKIWLALNSRILELKGGARRRKTKKQRLNPIADSG